MSGVSENLAAQLTEEELREMPMVDLVHKILQSKGEPMLYRDLLQEVARLKGFSEEETMRYIAQLYTEIDIDGRLSASAGPVGIEALVSHRADHRFGRCRQYQRRF